MPVGIRGVERIRSELDSPAIGEDVKGVGDARRDLDEVAGSNHEFDAFRGVEVPRDQAGGAGHEIDGFPFCKVDVVAAHRPGEELEGGQVADALGSVDQLGEFSLGQGHAAEQRGIRGRRNGQLRQGVVEKSALEVGGGGTHAGEG